MQNKANPITLKSSKRQSTTAKAESTPKKANTVLFFPYFSGSFPFSSSSIFPFRVLEKFSTDKARIGFTYNIFKEEYLLGLFLCCVESVFFVLNVTEVSFADLIAKCEMNIVIQWVAFNDFLRCDRCEIFLPTPLKFHLLDIEIQLVSAGVWGPGSSLLNVFRDFFLAEQENELRLMEIDHEKENSRNKMNLNNHINMSPEKAAPELEVNNALFQLTFKRI